MAEFKIDVEALGKKCFDEFQRILLDEYGMTLDELAELCKAKQEGHLIVLPRKVGKEKEIELSPQTEHFMKRFMVVK